ncbi:hypothetical protein H4R18_004040 [Coemansia javaensis]|uniref:Peptidase S1 domain-containing protein n=1 Tax=Coemansia javaensis TaxID=2761396 RepID=A0A9W8HAL0_9FUNG|nr:hypothetical protein H4R18_004040 [Coemansia javaensis]
MRILGHAALALAAGLSAVAAGPIDEQGAGRGLARRSGTGDLQAFKGAVLLKNGRPTSCEVALMYTTVGFVAANCLDFAEDSGKGAALNTTTQYQVAISQGLTTPLGVFPATQVTVNPKYDPKSFANNIAVIQFASNGGGDFVNYIASWRPEWLQLYLTRRSVGAGGAWAQPVLTQAAPVSDTAGCAAANELFALNQQDLICSQLVTQSPANASCVVPFGSVYGAVDPNVAIGALYSHSAVYGKSESVLCGNGGGARVFNYYIVMQNYVHWAMSVIGVKAPVYHGRFAEYTENLDPGYSMKIPSGKDAKGVVVIGGDLYGTGATGAAAETDGKSGMSTGAIIGLVLALLALLALLGWLLRRYLLKKLLDTRVRRWWFWGRHNKDNEPADVVAPAPDPSDPQHPTVYPAPRNSLPGYPGGDYAGPSSYNGDAKRPDGALPRHSDGGDYPIRF